jgi:hypothetical protein
MARALHLCQSSSRLNEDGLELVTLVHSSVLQTKMTTVKVGLRTMYKLNSYIFTQPRIVHMRHSINTTQTNFKPKYSVQIMKATTIADLETPATHFASFASCFVSSCS